MLVHHSADYGATDVDCDTTRKAAAIAASLQHGASRRVRLEAPEPVTRDQLLTVHDAAYVDAVLTGEPRSLAVTNQLPGWDAGLATAVCAGVGGFIGAARHAFEQRTIAGSLSTGLHHARRDAGWGGSTFNGVVLAAHAAVDAGARRVLVLDLDAHCAGGTTDLLVTSPWADRIELVDVAVDPFDYHGSSERASLTLTDGDHYLTTVEAELAAIVDPASIDLVLYHAGMDPHERCEGGAEGITALVLDRRERMVFRWLAAHRLPTAWAIAGGCTTHLAMSELVHLHRLTVDAAMQALPAYR